MGNANLHLKKVWPNAFKKKTFAGTCFFLSRPTGYKMQGTSEHSPLVIIIKQHETRMCLMNVEIIPAIQTSSRRILAAS